MSCWSVDRLGPPGRRYDPGTVRRLLLLGLAVALALVASGCGTLQPYAAKVNGERISQDDLESELEAILANEAYLQTVQENFQGDGGERAVGTGNGTFTTAFVAALLDRRISFELIDQELRRRDVTVSEADRAAAAEQVDQEFGAEVVAQFPASYSRWLVGSYARVAALGRALDSSANVTDEAVREFYEGNEVLFQDQSCARHILVETSEAATAIRSRLDAGEDFAAIARAESTDRGGSAGGSAAQGGDLGCAPRGSYVPEFEAALDGLTPGQVSAPVQTQFGFHVIQLVERKDISLAEARPQIARALEQQAASQDPVGRFVNEAVGRAEIVVNPRYGHFQHEDPPGVRPPPAVGAAAPTTALPRLTPAPAPAP